MQTSYANRSQRAAAAKATAQIQRNIANQALARLKTKYGPNANPIKPPQMIMQAVARGKRNPSRAKALRSAGTDITPAGLAYLKCATAPNDFSMDNFLGIPDEYDGRVVVKRHTCTTSLPSPGNDTSDLYLVLLPTPGVAFWSGSRAAGTTGAITITPTYFTDNSTLFPSGNENTVVNNFRYASNIIEVVPTVNEMTWTGSIEVWKACWAGGASQMGTAGEAYYVISGGDSLDSIKPQSVLPFNHGAYSVTMCTQGAYPFTPIQRATAPALVGVPMDSSGTLITLGGAQNFLGMGCNEAVIIKFPSYKASVNAALVRTWACVEYQLTSTSLLYDYSHKSPCLDPNALQLLRQFINEHPAAIPYYDNESFWRVFLDWAQRLSGALRVIPGPIGEVAGIVNLVSKTASKYA